MQSQGKSPYNRPGAVVTEPENAILPLALIIIFGIFATTLPQPQVLGRLPLQYVLKNEIHVTKTQMASFFFLCGLAWYFKPFAGILTDAFPLFGTRRRSYILIASILACFSWIAIIFVPHTYSALLWTAIIINVFMVVGSTVTGGFLVEAGQRLKATGRLTALRQVVQNFCTLVNGPIGGWLATAAVTGGLMRTGVLNAAGVLAIFPIAWVFLRERKVEVNADVVLGNAAKQLRTIFTSGTLWFALFFIGLFYFSPGFSTPLFYKQSEELKLSPQFIGNLGIYSGGAGILAALLYGQLIKQVNIRLLIFIGIFCAAAGTLFYLFYTGPNRAILIEAQNGFFFTFAEVSLMDLAARATPKGCEALGYSLILSMRNVALFSADIIGSRLSDNKWPFAWLVFLNAGTTALVLIFLPFLPRAIMQGKDTKASEEREVVTETMPREGEV